MLSLTKHWIAALATVCLMSSSLFAEVVIVENFGGGGAALNGTTADTFSSRIVTAGGSATWQAGSSFQDNGATTFNTQSAFLDLGSFVNDSKGTADGLFDFSATISPTSGGWLAISFFNDDANTDRHFAESIGSGQGSLLYRDTGELDGFGGPGADNNIDGPNGLTGDQQLTVVLDLRTHDNTTDFGNISFYQGDSETGALLGTHSYTSDGDFQYVGISNNRNTLGSFSNFRLEQVSAVPEPGSLAVLAFAGIIPVLTRRKRRAAS